MVLYTEQSNSSRISDLTLSGILHAVFHIGFLQVLQFPPFLPKMQVSICSVHQRVSKCVNVSD